MTTGAYFSDCRKYRYSLWRVWKSKGPFVAFIGLNPSTANATENDNTIRKVIKIADYNGFGGVCMLNLFAYISTQPEELQRIGLENAIGQYTNDQIFDELRMVSTVVAAWGNFKEPMIKIGNECRADQVINMVILAHGHMTCLKINKNGSPKHPLYCKDDTKLISYR